MRHRVVSIGGLFLVLTSVLGCGQSQVTVTGKLTKKGQPLALTPATNLVTLTFAPDSKDAKNTYPARYEYDRGVYEVVMPPGDYKVRLLIMDNTKRPPAMMPIRPDFSKNAFHLTQSQTLDLEIDP